MQPAADAVAAFHEKHGFAIDVPLETETSMDEALTYIGEDLGHRAKKLLDIIKQGEGDLRLERVQLLVEEIGEFCVAIGKGDIVETADAIADIIYVALGAAVCWGIPIPQVFWEVQRSNMTKPATGDALLKSKASKGEGYEPADVAGVIERCKA
jgi:hypothetical protein